MIKIYRDFGAFGPNHGTIYRNGKIYEVHRSPIGYRSKIYNFLIFKVIINYYLMSVQCDGKFWCYRLLKQSLEIKPFWKK